MVHEILVGYSDSFLSRTPVGSFLDLILQLQMSLSSVTVQLLVQGTRRALFMTSEISLRCWIFPVFALFQLQTRNFPGPGPLQSLIKILRFSHPTLQTFQSFHKTLRVFSVLPEGHGGAEVCPGKGLEHLSS